MKAYFARTDESLCSDLVFAKNANEAKYAGTLSEVLDYPAYKDVRVRRAKDLDDYDTDLYQYGYNFWDKPAIRLILVRDYCWTCEEIYDIDDCKVCCAKQYCSLLDGREVGDD